ncbi:hypothetical protein NP493_975g04066 [Ridgeia piscesae]|uniref:UBA domain-containing protein n=1 Tax=Ridgeia piscesae TaxID=27915 RepID=A0AAD9KIM5_RIDPI|nr:hypothetical protein NP493_975g04066 [Ridgeia piscesae]
MSRYSKMRADIQAIIRACDIDQDCPFKDFEFKDQSFSFNYYEDDTLLKYFTFNLSEDYPDHTVLTTCGQPGSHLPCETKTYDRRLPVIFRDLSSVFYKKMMVSLPGTGQRSDDTMDDDSYNDISDDDDEYDPEDASDEGEEEMKMNPQLIHDIERVKKSFGNEAVKYRAFQSIDDVEVSLHIEMILGSETAEAWKVVKDEPIIIRLHLSLSQYLEGPPAKVDVYQPSQKEKFGIGSQLCKIIESFINSNWTLAMPEKPDSATENIASGDKSDSTPPAISDDALAQILSMGFPMDLAQTALIMTQGDTERAVNLLVSDPDW